MPVSTFEVEANEESGHQHKASTSGLCFRVGGVAALAMLGFLLWCLKSKNTFIQEPEDENAHNGSKCNDLGGDCCLTPMDFYKACSNEYTPVIDTQCEYTTSSQCNNHRDDGGVCYGCFPTSVSDTPSADLISDRNFEKDVASVTRDHAPHRDWEVFTRNTDWVTNMYIPAAWGENTCPPNYWPLSYEECDAAAVSLAMAWADTSDYWSSCRWKDKSKYGCRAHKHSNPYRPKGCYFTVQTFHMHRLNETTQGAQLFFNEHDEGSPSSVASPMCKPAAVGGLEAFRHWQASDAISRLRVNLKSGDACEEDKFGRKIKQKEYQSMQCEGNLVCESKTGYQCEDVIGPPSEGPVSTRFGPKTYGWEFNDQQSRKQRALQHDWEVFIRNKAWLQDMYIPAGWGADACPSNYEPLSYSECSLAAAALNNAWYKLAQLQDVVAGYWLNCKASKHAEECSSQKQSIPDRPKGCYLTSFFQASRDETAEVRQGAQLFFNLHDTGAPHSAASPLCKPAGKLVKYLSSYRQSNHKMASSGKDYTV